VVQPCSACDALHVRWVIVPCSHYSCDRWQADPQHDPGRLTDAGIMAFACALAAAEPPDRPTLERLYLKDHPLIGAAAAAALTTAPFQRIRQLVLRYGGAQQLDPAEEAPMLTQNCLCDNVCCKAMQGQAFTPGLNGYPCI
jgi:hypothetical protein